MFFCQANFTNKVGSGWISVKEADARRRFSVQILDFIFWTIFMKLWIDIKLASATCIQKTG
jgi:hypothetical protein